MPQIVSIEVFISKLIDTPAQQKNKAASAKHFGISPALAT